MIQRNKNKTIHKNNLSINNDITFNSLNSLKSKPSVHSNKQQVISELDVYTKILNEEKKDFNTIKRLPEIKTTSTADYLKVTFVHVEETFSGYFHAKSKRGHQLEAVLKDEANQTHPVLEYKGLGEIMTLIVPVGEIGDRAFFKVTDCLTGAEATGEAITISLRHSFWKKIKGIISSFLT